MLGIAADYTEFDLDIIMLINSTFSTLNQIGIGPKQGFMIEGSQMTWEALLGGDPRLNSVKTYVHLKVRLLFDPPTVASVATAMQEQTKELEWRLNVVHENDTRPLHDVGSPVGGGSNPGTWPSGHVFDGGKP